MLRFVEEIMLLLLRDEGGKFVQVSGSSLSHALAAGVLMDLAMENRIDTDTENLILVNAKPLGDKILDPTLSAIVKGEQRDARYWVEQTARRSDEIREAALARLVQRGILEQREDRFLWVFSSRRYPMVDGTAEREVKLRIMDVLLSDEIPDPRDVVIISLADACGILRELMPRREFEKVSDRIEQVRKLDLIGRAMSQSIQDIELWLAASRIESRMF